MKSHPRGSEKDHDEIGSSAAEVLAECDTSTVHEFPVADAIAAFDLDLLHVQDCRAPADDKQAILLRGQNDAGHAAGRHWLKRLPPNPARRAPKRRECPRPGL